MKAFVVREFGVAALEEWPEPQPAAHEVIVDVAVIELNYPDLLVIDGRYQVRPPRPFVPGKSAVGRVSALGAEVTGLAVSDRVAVQLEHGACAQRVCAPAANCFPIPDGIDDESAAALGLPYQTAWFALRARAGFESGESVLVLGGSGSVGLASIQLAKAFGASVVIAVTRGSEKAARARAAGADHVVDTARSDLRDALRHEVRSVTGDLGADIAVDSIGGVTTEAALRSLAWCGRHVVVGFAGGDSPSFNANYLLVKNIAVLGLQWSDYRDRAPELTARAQAEIFELALRGRLAPPIDAVMPFADAMSGLQRIREGRASGRVLLKVQ
jgi:NADPH2:quinone reductase